MKITYTSPGAAPVEFKAVEHFQAVGAAIKRFGVTVNEAADAAQQWASVSFKLRWRPRPVSRKQRLRHRELKRRRAASQAGKSNLVMMLDDWLITDRK